MSKLIFKELYLFSPSEKKAKKISFSPKKTIITSSANNGTDRGKSVIMKSLYHTMGADCKFEDKWDDSKKTYILLFSIDDVDYFIFRHRKLFKVFDKEKNLLFSSISRHELAEKLGELFHFAVKLPRRTHDSDSCDVAELETASAVYNYLLYYVDQDGHDGSQFISFENLGEYPDFKENVLYYHFGAFDDEYYYLVQQQKTLEADGKKLLHQHEMTQMMLDKIYENLKAVSYAKDIDHLRADVNRTRGEYNQVAQSLNTLRQKLIELRNQKTDLEFHIHALKLFDKENERQIGTINKHICPLCKSNLDDVMNLRIKKYGIGDDIILLISDMQYSLTEVEQKISKYESDYADWLQKLSEYEASINVASAEINDVLKHKGYIDLKAEVGNDLDDLRTAIKENDEKLKELKKGLHKYSEIKKEINKRYFALMLADKTRFGLEGINEKSFENIKKTFSAGGSNNPLTTIVWYVNLIQLKHEFNQAAIDFPVVLDSPNNAETDIEKKRQLYNYICERITENQLIVSGLGYTSDEGCGDFDKVIFLSNSKYELLCQEDYEENLELLIELNNKQM